MAEIAGVVGHVKQWGLDSDDKQPLQAQMHTSAAQSLESIPPSPGWPACLTGAARSTILVQKRKKKLPPSATIS